MGAPNDRWSKSSFVQCGSAAGNRRRRPGRGPLSGPGNARPRQADSVRAPKKSFKASDSTQAGSRVLPARAGPRPR
eukprot:68308-Hanusia_phi.AAC.1